jgi:hypothetical protein
MADDFTNNITIISMIITISMAIGTFIMAWYTRKSAEEMNLTRKESNNAHIVIYFKSKGIKLNLIIKNIGKTTAKNVQIKTDPIIRNSKDHTYNSLMEDIPSFPPGFELTTYFDISRNYFKKFKEWKKYDVSISFTNIYGEKIKEDYTLDLNYLNDIHSLTSEKDSVESSLYNIKGELKKINKNLK